MSTESEKQRKIDAENYIKAVKSTQPSLPLCHVIRKLHDLGLDVNTEIEPATDAKIPESTSKKINEAMKSLGRLGQLCTGNSMSGNHEEK